MATRNDPIREMERFFDSAMRQAPSSPAMPLDLYRKGEEFVAQVDLPGVDPSTIDIDIEDRTLTIRAQRKAINQEGVQWLVHERPTGTFARQLTLGYGVAMNKIRADYDDGVVTLTIPVAEEAKPRKIQVQHGDSAKTIDASSTASDDKDADSRNSENE